MKLSQMAIMNVEKGEEIVGEWAHFIQRDNGLKERFLLGTAKNRDELNTVIEAANKNLLRLFGVTLQATDYDMYTLDGKKTSDIKQ